ncbi:MAG: SHOCT domain-containing protein [Saccharofermentanales bacterium]
MRNLGGGNWIGMMVGGFVFLLLLLLLVILIVGMFRRHGGPGMHQGPSGPGMHTGPGGPGHDEMHKGNVDSALAILNERYAKGEINQEEYLAKKNDLLK